MDRLITIGHSYGGLGGGRDESACWQTCGTKPGGIGRMEGDAKALPECDVETLMIPDHTAFQVHSFG